VVVSSTNARVSFTPPSLRNAPITGYKYSLNGGTTLNDVVGLDSSTNSFFISDFSYNIDYNLTLYANSPPGLSSPSAPKSFSYIYLPPLAPVIGNVLTAISFARVYFTPPATRNASITGYKYSFNSGATLFDVSGIDSSNSFAITDVQNDVSLNLTLYANSAAGLSVASVAKPIYILYKPPLPPAITTITTSKSFARVNFTVPGIRGAPITGYKYAFDISGTKYDASGVDISGNTGTFGITGVSNNTNVNVFLYANSGAGLSVASASKSFFILYTVPAAPAITTIMPANQSGTIIFTAGANNGADIINYLYSFNGGTTTFSTNATASPITITGLTNDTSYNVSLIAVNEVGNSPPSVAKLLIPIYKVPIAPTIGTISTTTTTTATIPFVAGASNGSPISTYMYSLNGGSLVDANTNASPIVITDLTSNTNYTIVLVAVNQVGQSLPSASKTFKTK
jgi:hypothetical protein